MMKNYIRKYITLPYEQKIVVNTAVGLCFSAILALGKFIIGLFTDYNMVSVAVYTAFILLAKLECVLGIKNTKRTFMQRNTLTAVFLFISSVLYIGFMSRMFFVERRIKNNDLSYVLILAFISFCELGFALAGLLRTKNKGHYYRNIKIVNFCTALIAILTTQMTIMNMQNKTGVADIINAYTGIGVGCFIALAAVYIFVAPKTSVIDREHGKFVLRDKDKNNLINMNESRAEIVLCKSFVYGDFVFIATVEGDVVEGDIKRGKSLWKRTPVPVKILACILFEILLFVWLMGRIVLFFRSINLPRRLEKKMERNGFQPLVSDKKNNFPVWSNVLDKSNE